MTLRQMDEYLAGDLPWYSRSGAMTSTRQTVESMSELPARARLDHRRVGRVGRLASHGVRYSGLFVAANLVRHRVPRRWFQ